MDEFLAQDFDSGHDSAWLLGERRGGQRRKQQLEFELKEGKLQPNGSPAQPRHMPPAKKLRSDAAAGERPRPRPSRAPAPTVAKDPAMPKPPNRPPPAYLAMTATGRSGAAKARTVSPAAHQAAERAKEQPGPEGWYNKSGQPWRPGKGGGQPRYGFAGGKNRDWHRQAHRAKNMGAEAYAKFKEDNPHPLELRRAWEWMKQAYPKQ